MFVYVIYSDRIRRRYIGHTSDLEKRTKEHNAGRVRSTKTGAPWRIIAFKRYSTRSDARWIERSLKRSSKKLNEFLGL